MNKKYVYTEPYFGENVVVYFKIDTYVNNKTLAVKMICEDGEPYAIITKNFAECSQYLTERYGENVAFVDENNCPNIGDFLIKNKIATKLDDYITSGFVVYKAYKFDITKF